jgi:hypothetical protein
MILAMGKLRVAKSACVIVGDKSSTAFFILVGKFGIQEKNYDN